MKRQQRHIGLASSGPRTHTLHRWCWPLALLLLVAPNTVGSADESEGRRVRMGARVLRSLLAADTRIEERAGPSGALEILVIGNDRPLMADVARTLTGGAAIGDRPVTVTLAEQPDDAVVPGVVFVAAPVDAQRLGQLVRWCRQRDVILYSPFEGDVEQGATAGLSIAARVQPYLNLGAMASAGMAPKPFFLRVSRTCCGGDSS